MKKMFNVSLYGQTERERERRKERAYTIFG